MPESEFAFSTHAKDKLAERNILEEWVWRTINSPTKKRMGEVGNFISQRQSRKGIGEFCTLSSIQTRSRAES